MEIGTIIFLIIIGVLVLVFFVRGIIGAFNEEHGSGHAIGFGIIMIYITLSTLGIIPSVI